MERYLSDARASWRIFRRSPALAASATTEFFQPAGVMTYVAIAGALLTTAGAALVRPLRRALALEPMEALRRE